MTTFDTTTERVSAVEFATTARIHLALNATNIERSLPFYRTLFGQEPTKVRPGYAKFEVAEPPVNLTLNEMPLEIEAGKGGLSHLGIQVKSTGAVLAAKERFVAAGLATFDEENVTCCYAVQDKVWVHDPDGNGWEFFVVLEADAPVHTLNKQGKEVACCIPGAQTEEIVCCTPAAQPLELLRK